ncbi:uncharacterized protein LOC115707297 [Cannabis sativa]|uniref:uncharacterized protein LOC115707297 n=1 Tax=Cannabis sativa TaxID=3483 RepID=UPI0029CA8004|nr:uncharacterized protein LOC115707297 [Cannabis sativa]XP_030491068.2 uncharacterized protein LOC115707297 [Cannabis sativa]XP_030491069.2 uncharacterized protein LOC115707297 [Cannabis sativa]
MFGIMPVSANEESGVKPVIRQSVDYLAGIPIKKRRFPLFRPNSPPPAEEPCLCPTETSSLQKDQSSLSQGSRLSYSSVATTSSGLSDVVKHPEPEARSSSVVSDHVGNINLTNIMHPEPEERSSSVVNDHVRNISLTNIKVEETSLTTQPGSAANMNGEEKLVKAKDPIDQTISVKNVLKPAGSLALNVGFDVPIKDRTEVKVEPEVAALQENSKSLLNLKEQFVLALSSKSSGSQHQETLEPVPQNLSSSKERSSSYCKGDAGEVNVHRAHLCANRANWDLNTPMDTWESSLNDAVISQTSAGGMVPAGRREDEQPLIGLAITSEKLSSIESKNVTDFSRLSSHKDKPGDSLHLQLSPSCLNFPIQEPSTASPKLDTNKVIPMTSMPRVVLPSINIGKGIIRPVKSEPVEERVKVETHGAESFSLASLDSSVASSVNGLPLKLNEQMVEGTDKHFSCAVRCKTADIPCPIENSSFLTENKNSTAAVMCKNTEVASPVRNPSSSAEYKPSGETSKTAESICSVMNSSFHTALGMGGEHINQSERFSSTSAMHLEACESSGKFTLDKAATSVSIDVNVDTTNPERSKVDDSKKCGSKVANDLPLRGDGEGSASDDEKINISAETGDSYSSDYESDGNHAIDMSIDMELDSDYEDGEIREPIEHIAVEVTEGKKGQSDHVDNSFLNREVVGTMGFINNADHAFEGKESKCDSTEIDKKGVEEASGVPHSIKCESGFDKDASFQESLTVESSASGAFLDETNNAAISIPPSESVKRDVQECQDTNLEQAACGGEVTQPTIAQGTDLRLDSDELVQQSDTALAKSSLYFDNAGKDVDSGTHRSRMINLPRSSGSSSPGRNRTFSGRGMPFRAGRERFSDVTNERDIVYFRGREENYGDDTHKFFRERHHEQTTRNSRFNYVRGRGRINNRINTFRGDRDSDRNFASEFPNSQQEYRVPRHKYESSDVDHEYSTYNVTQDGGFVGSGRGGRKHLNDEGPFGRRIPSRNQSPGAGPAGRGRHMVRRMPRNISPRCVGEDDSEMVRHRRNDKFARSFQYDDIDPPEFSRPQPPFEGVDGQFSQGNRNFPSVQRKVMHRSVRSKSPVSGRNRSPGPWSSPRRRSPYGFSGHPDLAQRTPFYRIDRMRSPDRRCFAGEVVVRRHDMRGMDSGRGHGHPGSVMPNRSPSDRIAIRERRFGGLDPQERPESDDFFGGRLHELGSDVNGEERRFGERRGPVRPYRTPFNVDDVIDRDFHIRIKNRPGNAPRRMRNIEEQEANYRQGGQMWHNNEFDEMSRVKRKRF